MEVTFWAILLKLRVHTLLSALNATRCAVSSRSVVSDSVTHGLYSPWNSPGQNTGVGSLCLFQGIFPTQGLNPTLPHCRQIHYQLSHKGSPITSLRTVYVIEIFFFSPVLFCVLLQLGSTNVLTDLLSYND